MSAQFTTPEREVMQKYNNPNIQFSIYRGHLHLDLQFENQGQSLKMGSCWSCITSPNLIQSGLNVLAWLSTCIYVNKSPIYS